MPNCPYWVNMGITTCIYGEKAKIIQKWSQRSKADKAEDFVYQASKLISTFRPLLNLKQPAVDKALELCILVHKHDVCKGTPLVAKIATNIALGAKLTNCPKNIKAILNVTGAN
jgi:transcription initiation factor TFIIIB Brf1 subunit/transcription initiation factor TFIIB